VQNQPVVFFKHFIIDDTLKADGACLELSADNEATVELNGHLLSPTSPAGTKHPGNLYAGGSYRTLSVWQIAPDVFDLSGNNTLKITVTDTDDGHGGLVFCLRIKTKHCPCDTALKPPPPPIPSEQLTTVPCDSFTACCVSLCKGWNTVSFPVREYKEPWTTKLREVIPAADQHSDIGRNGGIYSWALGWPFGNSWSPDLSGAQLQDGQETPKIGFVVYSNCATQYIVAGIPVKSYTRTIRRGWNLIGTVLCAPCAGCGKPATATPWSAPAVTISKMDGTPLTPISDYLKGPYYNCGDWSLIGPVSTLDPFKGYWVCTQEDSLRLTMNCDSVVEPYTTCQAETVTVTACDCDAGASPGETPGPSHDLKVWMTSVHNVPDATKLDTMWVNPATGLSYTTLIECDTNDYPFPSRGTGSNSCVWAHTFYFPLPKPGCEIVGATLAATLKPIITRSGDNNHEPPENDKLLIVCASNGGSGVWERDSLNDASVLGPWSIARDWSTYPHHIQHGVLTEMGKTGALDVLVYDDTSVDCMILEVWYGPPITPTPPPPPIQAPSAPKKN